MSQLPVPLVCLMAAACAGSIDDAPGAPSADEGTPIGASGGVPPTPGGDWWLSVGNLGVRRLTVKEIDNTLLDLLGDTSRPAATFLPADTTVLSKTEETPFDNDSRVQRPSAPLLSGLEVMSQTAAEKALADPAVWKRVVPCVPAGADDAKCLRAFLTRVGRRLLRRPMTAGEIDLYVSSFLTRDVNDFHRSAELALRALLMEPEFLYRFEIGTPVKEHPGLFRLTPWEIASRLSFLMWGAGPDDDLLDLAANDQLRTAEEVTAVARQMLAESRGQDNVKRFHALWLGYENLQRGDLTAPMKAETSALVDQVVFKESGPWTGLFTATKTYVNSSLAAHYRIPAPPSRPDWVTYPSSSPGGAPGRRGLLSHGSFLAIAAADDNETLMTIRRGKLIRERLFGADVPAKPKISAGDCVMNVTSPCKWEQSAPRRTCDKCAACHGLLDTVGFGLDNFDALGRSRTAIPTKNLATGKETQCPVHGDGIIDGQTFRGPAQLGDLLVKSGVLERGLATQLYRFAIGRHETSSEQPFIDDLARTFSAGDRRFQTLIFGLVSSDAFSYRRE